MPTGKRFPSSRGQRTKASVARRGRRWRLSRGAWPCSRPRTPQGRRPWRNRASCRNCWVRYWSAAGCWGSWQSDRVPDSNSPDGLGAVAMPSTTSPELPRRAWGSCYSDSIQIETPPTALVQLAKIYVQLTKNRVQFTFPLLPPPNSPSGIRCSWQSDRVQIGTPPTALGQLAIG